MSKPIIVNIINFIRAVEPRREMDLVEPVTRQIELIRRHNFPATWLIQYDALLQGPYVHLLKQLGEDQEIGGWFELVQPLVEKAGLPWRGRYPWDWHTHVGFSVGYTPAERKKLIDVFMDEFKAIFGRYPTTMGSWLMDAYTLAYLHDHYGIIGSCNCKDQYGTDGYTLWGGYWNQAYYPSRKNALMPGQTESGQINMPIFRMLGSDPIDQYDAGMLDGHNCNEIQAQSVVSLEPVYKEGGGNPCWVNWFFKQLQANPSLAFQYTQVGQENSFGWSAMERGYRAQMTLLDELRDTNPSLRIETLEASSRWFRNTYPLTPATAISATSDYKRRKRGSTWYNSSNYRANIYWDSEKFAIRDIHLFDENYQERYLSDICPSAVGTYDTLPVCEGFLWSSPQTQSGFQLMENEDNPFLGEPVLSDNENGGLTVDWITGAGHLTICFDESTITLTLPRAENFLKCVWAENKTVPFLTVDDSTVNCSHEGHSYTFQIKQGRVELDLETRHLRLYPERSKLLLRFAKPQ